MVLKESLERFEVYDVAFFYDGQSTIDFCKKVLNDAVSKPEQTKIKPIDLVLTDYLMPFKSGIQVITEVR